MLGRIPDVDMVYFACHGMSDLADPSCNYPALDGKLTVQLISEVNLQRARVSPIFLHAGLLRPRFPELADEAIHLAGGFQAVGFAHVIAMMWPALDHISVRMAEQLYREDARSKCWEG